MNSIEDAVKALAYYKNDPAYITDMKNELRRHGVWQYLGLPEPVMRTAAPPPAFPPVSSVTCVQATLFDNHSPKSPARKRPRSRWAVAVEVWTQPADAIVVSRKPNYSNKSNVVLQDAKTLRDNLRNYRKPGRRYAVDQEYLELLDALANQAEGYFAEEGALVGLVSTNVRPDDAVYDQGCCWHPFQFLLLTVRDGKATDGRLWIAGESIDLGEFVPHDAAGKDLAGCAVAQSRTDLCGFSQSSWKTNEAR